ncbi:MAG: aminotransferase class IV [Campylobacteraceae bacterium]|nr:aminotransferase class IV [Campylobacteraceae bacterium]
MKCAQKSIYPAFETIKSMDGELQNIRFHQKRFDKTRAELYGAFDSITLSSLLSPPKAFTCKVRVEYAEEILKIEYIPYPPRTINSFYVVESSIEYTHKLCDRVALNALLKEGYDDIIITKNGLLCDTSIANIALHIDGVWLTPNKPLLEGTTRSRLLESGFLSVEDLDSEAIQKADKFAIMNALIGFKIIENVRITRD